MVKSPSKCLKFNPLPLDPPGDLGGSQTPGLLLFFNFNLILSNLGKTLKVVWLKYWIFQWCIYIPGFDINGCPIARGKWNASSGKWKRHPTCPIGQVKMILWYVQFFKSKMINIELFSVGSRGEFYLNIASYVSCILLHIVLFCWLRNSSFSNKDRVIYFSQSRMPN